MPPFIFETLLNQRIHQEEKIQKEMAICSRTLLDEQQILDQFENDRNRVLQEVRLKQNEGVTVSEQVLYMNFLEGMVSLIQIQNEKVRQGERQLDHKRLELIEAVKKRKILEKLKEKSQKCHMDHLLKLEQNLLDEAAVCRFGKNFSMQT
ncbi:MAG: flagellar export protein FliJ [Desulfatirhabdiaceae bacterium]